jgi:hypothetical protein
MVVPALMPLTMIVRSIILPLGRGGGGLLGSCSSGFDAPVNKCLFNHPFSWHG